MSGPRSCRPWPLSAAPAPARLAPAGAPGRRDLGRTGAILGSVALLDQIGPVMVGPSSSHTAGACRIALLARHCLLARPRRAPFVLHGPFATTARGPGTGLALAAGRCGAFPAGPRLRDASDLARAEGLQFEFAAADLGDVHPTTVLAEAEADGESVSLLGSSLGGGLVQVSRVNGLDARFSGSYYTLLVLHKDQPGVIARVARVVADDEGNIGSIFSARERRGGLALMSVEIDKRLDQYALDYLTN